MNHPRQPSPDTSHRIATFSLLAIGLLMLVIAWFFDPIGQDPDTGVVDLTPTQARWLLGVAGGLFVAAGAWSWRKAR